MEDLIKKPIKGYNGWLISDMSRALLLSYYPPKFTDVYLHHITNKFPAWDYEPLPEETDLKMVGYAVNEEGIEAFVVSVNNSINRTDGSIFHCTLSLDSSKGFVPKDSNTLVVNGWDRLELPININTTPNFFKR